MRVGGSSQYVGRRAICDAQVGEALIHAGESVVILLGAATLDATALRRGDEPGDAYRDGRTAPNRRGVRRLDRGRGLHPVRSPPLHGREASDHRIQDRPRGVVKERDEMCASKSR